MAVFRQTNQRLGRGAILLAALLALAGRSAAAAPANPPPAGPAAAPAAAATGKDPAPHDAAPAADHANPDTAHKADEKAAPAAGQKCDIPAAEDICKGAAQLPACASPKGNHILTVTVDDSTLWRPQAGELKFKISGAGFAAGAADIAACVRWSHTSDNQRARWASASGMRLVDGSAASSATFVATVPGLDKKPSSLIDRVTGKAAGESTALGLVPFATLRVVAKTNDGGGWQLLDVSQPLGITSTGFAAGLAAALMLIGGIVLYVFGNTRRIPASGSPMLQVISTRNGYASLSQLQILLWAFVIGGSAIYVMALSGNLIVLSAGTLTLLGISGVATLGAKLQSATSDSSAGPPPGSPGDIASLTVIDPVGDSDVRLTWPTPSIGAVDRYTVQYREALAPGTAAGTAPNPWIVATRTLAQPGFRVVGLDPGKAYEFQVAATNTGGAGLSPIVPKTTAAAPAGAPVTDLAPTANVTNSAFEVAWQAPAALQQFRLEFRRRDSDDLWTGLSSRKASQAVADLDARTSYDVRVAGAPLAAPVAYGPWTYLQLDTKGPRVPRWSDLVISNDGGEIDVSRVQMLFFTAIGAIFVVLRVISSGSIPEISTSFLLLMGISNGVYLTSKFIPS